MKKRLIKLIALVMCAAMLTGCAASGGVKNLTDGVNAADVTLPEVLSLIHIFHSARALTPAP